MKTPAKYLSLALVICSAIPAYAQSTWKEFSPPSGEFSVKMPDLPTKANLKLGDDASMYFIEKDGVRYGTLSAFIQDTDGIFDQFVESVLKPRRERAKIECPKCQFVSAAASGDGWSGRTVSVITEKNKKVPFALFALSTNKKEAIALVVSADCSEELSKKFFDSLQVDNAKVTLAESQTSLAKNPPPESLVLDTSTDDRKWIPAYQRHSHELLQSQLIPENEKDNKDPKEIFLTTFRNGTSKEKTPHSVVLGLADNAKARGLVTQFRIIKDEPDDCIAEWIEMGMPPQYSAVRALRGKLGDHILLYTGQKAALVPSERNKWVDMLKLARLQNVPLLPGAAATNTKAAETTQQ